MLAQRLPGLLPPLSRTQALEAAAVAARWPVMRRRPRAAAIPGAASFPSVPALVGGGTHPGPEISLAHHGVLFLDELSVRWVSAVCLRQI